MFYPSNFAPLWTKSYDQSLKKDYGRKAANYFRKNNIDEYKGGIPTSLDDDNEQWDLPNAWPPLQEIIIIGKSYFVFLELIRNGDKNNLIKYNLESIKIRVVSN